MALAALAFCVAVRAAGPVGNVQDLWWGGPEQGGWGVSITQHGDRLFCILFVYDETKHTTWYVMPSGEWNEAHTAYRGKLYWPRGTPFSTYDARLLAIGEPHGDLSIEFDSENSASIAYTIAGVYKEKRHIERLLFGPIRESRMPGLTDLWWGGAEQNGWGVMIAQQFDSLFITWFTYVDKSSYAEPGHPAWFVMPAGQWTGPSIYEGRIYRPFGCIWLGYEWCRPVMPDNGAFRLTFEDRDHAFLEYSVLGQRGILTLSRLPF